MLPSSRCLATPRIPPGRLACAQFDSIRALPEGHLLAASRNASAVPAGPRRVSFARVQEPLEVPDLLALQTESFDWLLGNEKWKARVEAARQA
ncbi:MAG: rpoB, partial [Nonomuraea muscovyensis]|nr:rpoB [Nonomuraea muscovyensis]